MSNDAIGEVAGEVWRSLVEKDGQSLAALIKSIDAPPELALAAIGWLAREGKLQFTVSSRSVKVSLQP